MLSPLPEQISLQTNSREFRESEENYYARSQNLTQLRNVYPLINPGGNLVGLTWAQLVCELLLPSGIKECCCGCPTRQGHQALLVPQYLLCLLCKGQSAKVKVRVGLWSHNKTGHDKHIDCMTVVWQTNNMTVHNKHQSCDSSNTPVMWLSHDKHMQTVIVITKQACHCCCKNAGWTNSGCLGKHSTPVHSSGLPSTSCKVRGS